MLLWLPAYPAGWLPDSPHPAHLGSRLAFKLKDVFRPPRRSMSVSKSNASTCQGARAARQAAAAAGRHRRVTSGQWLGRQTGPTMLAPTPCLPPPPPHKHTSGRPPNKRPAPHPHPHPPLDPLHLAVEAVGPLEGQRCEAAKEDSILNLPLAGIPPLAGCRAQWEGHTAQRRAAVGQNRGSEVAAANGRCRCRRSRCRCRRGTGGGCRPMPVSPAGRLHMRVLAVAAPVSGK